MTHKSTWKAMERRIAAKWGTRRTPLSGENSGHGGGDIILTKYDVLVECKLRAKFRHHALYREAQADAKKHGKTPEHTVLVTKKKGETGELVVLDGKLFHEVLLPLWRFELNMDAEEND